MEWDKEAAQASTESAEVELKALLAKLTGEERNGVEELAFWWRKWYNGHNDGDGNFYHATGHKALAQVFKKLLF